MSSLIGIVTEFCDMWGSPGGWRQAVDKHFTDDSVYENIGMSKSVGKLEVLDFIRHYDETTGGGWMVVEITAIASTGNVVLTERIDHMVDGKGNIFLTTPVMGAFEFRDDKIVAWRDYFNTACVVPPYDGPGSLMVPQAQA